MPARTWTARGRACIGVRAFAVLAFAAFLAPSAFPQKDSGDLASASLEDLMNMKVVSVSKTEEDLSRTAAAVFVITQQDIRESGATNIPDLLRMVPGVDVAQIDANTWAISIRGFNARFSNELLVLVDGRSVYTPTFGGVYWDSLAIPLEDIQRIEVVRGPGGSAWGTNAVNGVINIITKKTSDTHGALVVGGGGNTNQGFDTLQYGGNFRSTDYRAYATYFNSSYLPALGGPYAAMAGTCSRPDSEPTRNLHRRIHSLYRETSTAFLYNFAKFIDWPPSSFATPQSPFAICILGKDPFGSAIDDTLGGKVVGERPVVVQRSREPEEVRHCQIVFVGASEKNRLPDIIASLQKGNVLIVGETDRFADSGGTIQLTLEENHVHFAINTDAAEMAGLRISSKLLALAKIVHGTEGAKN
jgi:YfiR/HmsC-like/TonB-dependent Receptor Plug Domain